MRGSTDDLHRVRRLRWQARAPSAADAFALQSLLRRRSEEVGTALEQAFAGLAPGDEVWHLPSLTLRLDASSLAQMDADLPGLVASALHLALQVARPAEARRRVAAEPAAADEARVIGSAITRATTAEVAQAALRHYLATGSLPWALAGLSLDAQQQTLQGAAQSALEALLTQPNKRLAALTDLLGATTLLPARLGALLRWLPLLGPAQRQRWLAHSPRPTGVAPTLADAWITLLASPGTPLEWAALWLAWPTHAGLHAPATTPTEPTDALAVARWIAELPADIATQRLPSPVATHPHLAAALLYALVHDLMHALMHTRGGPAPSHVTAPPPTERQSIVLARPIAATPETQLVPLAGLVLLHPYLPRFLKGCGLLDDKGLRISDTDLPRACALLHALACGAAEATEHQLPLIKLLLGRAPDIALTGALPRPTTAEREEIDALLAAVRGHWKALGNTSADGLRLSFLQRHGLLREAEGAWQIHMQAEGFDRLLDLLPWSISLVKQPWMPLPLMVEWHAP